MTRFEKHDKFESFDRGEKPPVDKGFRQVESARDEAKLQLPPRHMNSNRRFEGRPSSAKMEMLQERVPATNASGYTSYNTMRSGIERGVVSGTRHGGRLSGATGDRNTQYKSPSR